MVRQFEIAVGEREASDEGMSDGEASEQSDAMFAEFTNNEATEEAEEKKKEEDKKDAMEIEGRAVDETRVPPVEASKNKKKNKKKRKKQLKPAIL